MKGLKEVLKCFDHDESFSTPSEMDEHRAKVSHKYTGTSRCQDCGAVNCEINYEGKLEAGKSPPAICDDCENKYVAELKAKGKI